MQAMMQSSSHGLTRPLVVSLTSWAPRYKFLRYTLRSLVKQSISADKIVLWIVPSDVAEVQLQLGDLRKFIEVRSCPESGPYKKLIQASQEFSDCYIVTVDDDIFYHEDWLKTLISDAEEGDSLVRCWYGMRYHHTINGKVAPYGEWTFDPQDRYSRLPSDDLIPTGVGGILYPPSCFHQDIANRELIEALAPNADDIWFYAMTRLAGFKQLKVGGRFNAQEWPGTQRLSLSRDDKFFARNDAAVANITEAYGDRVFSQAQLECAA